MDARHFDGLTKSVSQASSRRGLLATLPVLGGLFARLDPDEVDAKGRRKRRKKRHKHVNGRRRGKKNQQCKPHAKTKTCSGTCGSVGNNCQQTVDCGSCACNPVCDPCFICQEQGPNAVGACELDPEQVGDPCGSEGQVCQAGGLCACQAGSCANPTPICDDGVCVGCVTAAECGEEFLCLADGSCQACDVTCPAGTCAGGALQAALSTPGPDNLVYVCPGRYTGNFSVNTAVTLIGAGDGADPASNTILDGGGSGTVVAVVIGTTVTLRRLRVRGAGATPTNHGISSHGTLTLEGCTVTENGLPSGQGNGISHLGFGDLTLIDSRVTANHGGLGGGIFFNAIHLILANSEVSGNTASDSGGGISLLASSATFTNSHVDDNEASGEGGGIHIQNASTVVFDSESGLTENRASQGGGIHLASGTLTLNGTNVTGNEATISGDDIYNGSALQDNGATIGECCNAEFGTGCPAGSPTCT